MKQILTVFLVLTILRPLSSIAQIGVADPVTGNAAINFYGVVEDQDGKPLIGVKVNIRLLVGYLISPAQLGTRYDRIILATDTNGNFILTGLKGHSVEIESIEKDGYKLSVKSVKLFPYSWSANIFHPNPNSPVVFKMWKQKGAEQLVQPRMWNGKVSCDGTTNRFDLFHGKKNANGDLEIVCTRIPLNILPRENRRFDYKIVITVLGGSIQSTEDEFTYLAPENGYSPVFTFAQKADDSKWQGRLKQEFYIKTASGNYGTLSVDWYSSDYSPTHVDWNCSINPSGSRNLER